MVLEQWGHLSQSTLQRNMEKLSDYLNKDTVPLMILAVENGSVHGCAYLCFHEMSMYTDKAHWLGGVYVDKPFRGNKLASKLVQRLASIANSMGITELHLQTEDLSGGLYAKLGFKEIDRVNYRGVEVSVRRKQLKA